MTILSPQQIRQGLANAGFPASSLDTMTAIILAESNGGDTNANSGLAYGIAQIADSHGYSHAYLSDPANSFAVAFQLFSQSQSARGDGFLPWDAYSYLPPYAGCAHPDPATGECFVGAGQGSFLQFLGLVNSNSPVSSISSGAGDGTGEPPPAQTPSDTAALFGFGPDIPNPFGGIPNPIDVIKSIWDTASGALTSAPQKAAGAITQAALGTVSVLAKQAFGFLQPLLVRTGFFFLGLGVIVVGGMILAAPTLQVNMQQADADKRAAIAKMPAEAEAAP